MYFSKRSTQAPAVIGDNIPFDRSFDVLRACSGQASAYVFNFARQVGGIGRI